jgi:hypothetical protein
MVSLDLGWRLMGYGMMWKIVERWDFQHYKIGISLHKYKLGLNLK